MFNHSWPDLSAFNATGGKRTRRKGSKRASKVRVTSFAKDGSRIVVEPKPKATRAPKVEATPAPVDVYVVPEASIQVRNTDGDIVSTGTGTHAWHATPNQASVRPSFASRKAAMVARRGY